MMHVDIIHCNENLVGGADHGLREAGDLWYDPLIKSHNAFAATLRKKYTAPVGPILPRYLPGYRKLCIQSDATPTTLAALLDREDDEILMLSATASRISCRYHTACLSIMPSTFKTYMAYSYNAVKPALSLSKNIVLQAGCRSTRFPWMV